ncbi:MAG: cytochrome c oxidase accessory protein CcoG [Gammaproteobacteria bacterium]|nr:MAG: cytochrome c oxidase accessory protein CcoG [Gammaproteobacteria bacterium]
MGSEGKQDRRAPDESSHVLYLYETRNKIYAKRFVGFFRKLKKRSSIPLLLGYLLTPWLQIDGRQAIWFDLPERQFHIFWMTFWPQDFMLLAWLLIICAFALFAVTVLVGRIWCGFTCPQTVWTMMFMGVEHFFEGGRNKRIKLDLAPWNFNKIWRKGGKHGGWLLIAFITGFTFVGYFNPIRQLSVEFLTFSAQPATVFWAFLFAAMTYMNAGYLREQVCKYMCPYARFQSVMFDPDTLIVSYDEARGEQRGARRRDDDRRAASDLGDCVDCGLCVQVCPVGIDIRDGLQSECISCGLCIDACNAIMDKVALPGKLISFTTENKLENSKTRILRPRLVGYAAGLVVMISLFLYVLVVRVPLELDVVRDRSLLYRETSRGLVENIFTLRISNMDNRDHDFQIRVEGDYEFKFIGDQLVSVEAGEVLTHLVRLALDPGFLETGNADITFVVQASDDDKIIDSEHSRFIGPFSR